MIQYPKISLTSIYGMQEPEGAFFARELYYLLGERQPDESISHKMMPSWSEHRAFIASKPYKEWYMVENSSNQIVGAVYISKLNEIGISIFTNFRRQKYASAAIYAILEMYPDETFFANINPENLKSVDLFKRFGFIQLQNTYTRDPHIMLDV